jgi:hypothetical protein
MSDRRVRAERALDILMEAGSAIDATRNSAAFVDAQDRGPKTLPYNAAGGACTDAILGSLQPDQRTATDQRLRRKTIIGSFYIIRLSIRLLIH